MVEKNDHLVKSHVGNDSKSKKTSFFPYFVFFLTEGIISAVWFVFMAASWVNSKKPISSLNDILPLEFIVSLGTPESFSALMSAWAFVAMFFALRIQAAELALQRKELEETRCVLDKTQIATERFSLATERLALATEQNTDFEKFELQYRMIGIQIEHMDKIILNSKQLVQDHIENPDCTKQGRITDKSREVARAMGIDENNAVELQNSQVVLTLTGKQQKLQREEQQMFFLLRQRIILDSEFRTKYMNHLQ